MTSPQPHMVVLSSPFLHTEEICHFRCGAIRVVEAGAGRGNALEHFADQIDTAAFSTLNVKLNIISLKSLLLDTFETQLGTWRIPAHCNVPHIELHVHNYNIQM
jgi:hypothetical protein